MADVAGAVVTAALVFGATPAVLVILVGDPLGQGLGHQLRTGPRDAMASLAVLAWVAWVACCAQLVRQVGARVRTGDTSHVVGAPLGERVAARIAAGILSLGVLGAPFAVSSLAGAARPSMSGTGVAAVSRPISGPVSPTLVAPVPATYVVVEGDSLWSIADRQLGDGADWTEIAALNLGRTMADGTRFVDPAVIRVGWSLTLPAGPATAPVAAPISALTLTAPDDRTRGDVGSTVHVALATDTDVAVHHHDAHRAAPRGQRLPELVVLGLGTIGCAALARRARRVRLLRRGGNGLPLSGAADGERAVDAATLLARFDGAPALQSFEAANCLLGRALQSDDWGEVAPHVSAICVNPSGIEFWLGGAARRAPEGFELAHGGRVWQAGHAALTTSPGNTPALPVAIPVGDDNDGTWLLPLERGTCLPVLGPAAGAFVRAALPVLGSWSWSDQLVITSDPGVAAAEVALAGGGTPLSHIVFVGDPSALTDHQRAQVAILTTLPSAPASDITVLVDHRAASIHPLGRSVHPNLLTDDTALAVETLLSPPPQREEAPDEPMDARPVRSLATTEGVEHLPYGAGQVEVRLLTATPRLEGLHEPLPPNRERRAVELVAYLALHRPDPVTSDRLRTRVLGSPSTDAASKTLFNTAAAARRALGTDADGRSLLPAGTRTGQYRVSDAVSVDLHRATDLVEVGRATQDPAVAMAHLRAALELVEGEPLANVLSGYTWWEAEGHGARAAAVLVNAACDLAALAVEAGHFELAHWGLEKARLLDPYSEALSRAAMQVAAAAGDADRLRLEWRECQRRMDELDPGSTPSPRTERLYGELTGRVPSGTSARRRVPVA